MKVRWVCNDGEQTKEVARTWWDRKAGRLERLLDRFDPDLCEAHLTLAHYASTDTYELRGVLRLPAATLVSEKKGTSVEDVVEQVVDTLAREVKKHKQVLSKEKIHQRRRERQRNLVVANDLLARDVTDDRHDRFFQLLEPLLGPVYEHAQHLLRTLEAEGALGHNQVTARDLVDEVIVRAWERLRERPQHLDLELWLTSLLRERIGEIASTARGASLETEVGVAQPERMTPEEDVDEAAYWLERLFQRSEPLTLEDLIQESEPPTADGEASDLDGHERLYEALAKLSHEARDTLVMHAVVGYEVDEIARIRNVPEAEVAREVDDAREALRRDLLGAS